MNWFSVTLLMLSTTCSLWAQDYYSDDDNLCASSDKNDRYWEKAMYRSIRSQYDTAYYLDGSLCFVRLLNGDSSSFYHYYDNGYLHVKGTGLRAKRNRLKGREGNWTIYHPNGKIKEFFGFRRARWYGPHVKLSKQGDTLRRHYHRQRVMYGFNVGWLRSFLHPEASGNATFKLTNTGSLGFTLGVLIHYLPTNRIMLRTAAATSFLEYYLRFERGIQKENTTLNWAAVDFSLHALGQPVTKFPAYVVAGATYSASLGNNEEQPALLLGSNDFSLDIGLAYAINLKFISIMPEIKFSQGMIDMKGSSNSPYAQSISSIYRNQLSFILHFYQ